eukprot:g8424.t1
MRIDFGEPSAHTVATVNHAASPLGEELAAYDDIGLGSSAIPNGRELSAWLVSLVANVSVLIFFWTIHLTVEQDLVLDITSEVTQDDKVDVAVAVALDEVGNNADNSEESNSRDSAPLTGRDIQKQIDDQLEETKFDAPVPQSQPVTEPPRSELMSPVVASGDTVDTGGTEGAIDVLTREIENSLKERKTFVIWLFDASQSLNSRRKLIANRFENVYKQLGQRNKGLHRALQTAVVSYGRETKFLTDQPVYDVEEVAKAVHRIQPDKSGEEYVFTAVNAVLRKYTTRLTAYRNAAKERHNVMMIIVTDERGDDYAGKSKKDYKFLDNTIRDVRRNNIKVHCIGNAAVFGREKSLVAFKDENGYQWNDCEVDQGPETVRAERLQLRFWGRTNRDLDRLSANYGPFALTRLCAETGGLFLITEHSQGAVRFPIDVMRNYRPYYGTIEGYIKDLNRNRAKMALSRVAQMTMSDSLPSPQLVFQATNDTILRQQISQAQRPLARLNYRLKELLDVLENAEKDREKITEPRWRAGFDLAMGRLLAMRVRAFGYQTVVAEMSSSPLPFKTKGSNQWRLVASKNWETYSPTVKKIAKKARMYLKRVIDEHPDTPWALLAEHELSTELGWEWRESKMVVLQKDTTAAVNLNTTAGGAISETVKSASSQRVTNDQPVNNNRLIPELVPVSRNPSILGVSKAALGTDFGDDEFKGEPTAMVDGYGTALGLITQELQRLMRKDKLLVVWLFDESESMKDDQREIAKNFGKVYQELKVVKAKDKAIANKIKKARKKGKVKKSDEILLTAIYGYGAKVNKLLDPTADVDKIRTTIEEKIPIDETGAENTFGTLLTVIKTHYRRAALQKRKLVVIVVSDESGSDGKLVEVVLQEAKRAKSPLYFLGREAIFGYPYARHRWIDPVHKLPHWIRIDRGPETAFPECLQWNGLHARWDAFSSGFGPYEQVRLARETNGMFFVLPSEEENLSGAGAREKRQFLAHDMREYHPLWQSRAEYRKSVDRNKTKFRKTIWKVIVKLNPTKDAQQRFTYYDPNLNIRRHHYPLELDKFKAEAAKEVVKAYAAWLKVGECIDDLESIASLRPKEEAPRWRANYDLARAQCMAYRVRLFQYLLAMDDHVNANPPKVPRKPASGRLPSNRWDVGWTRQMIIPDDAQFERVRKAFRLKNVSKEEFLAKLKELERQATELYVAVEREHKGTPWARRALYERQLGFGMRFYDVRRDPNYDKPIKKPNF